MSSDLAARPSHKARFALWVSLWGIFVSNITLTILTIALPYIAKDLHADRALTNWVSLGPMLVVALLTPAAGRAADNYGRKRVWLWGFGLALIGIAGSALAPSLGPLVLARVVTGIGTALLIPAALAITTGLYPPEERATPIGYWTSTVAISPMLGVLIGGALLEVMSWRWLFVGQVLLGLPPFIAAWIGFKEQRFETSGGFDWEGSFAIGIASLALMLGATWLGSYGAGDLHVIGAVLCAVTASLWAVSAERRAHNPVMPPLLLADEAVRVSLASRFALNFTYMGAFMVLPYLLSEVWHWSALKVSTGLIWRPLAMGIIGPFAGILAQRFGAARLVLSGAWLILLSTGAFLALDQTPHYALLALGLSIAGVGLGLSSPGSVAVVTARVGPELLGTVSGLMTLTATLANALGMAMLFAVVEASGGVHHALAYRTSFCVGAAVVGLGVVCGMRLLWLERSEMRRDAK